MFLHYKVTHNYRLIADIRSIITCYIEQEYGYVGSSTMFHIIRFAKHLSTMNRKMSTLEYDCYFTDVFAILSLLLRLLHCSQCQMTALVELLNKVMRIFTTSSLCISPVAPWNYEHGDTKWILTTLSASECMVCIGWAEYVTSADL